MPGRLKNNPSPAQPVRIGGFLFTLLPIFLLAAGCVSVYNRATEKQELLLLDTENEVRLGEDIDKETKARLEIVHDAGLMQRLERIGNKVASASDRTDLSYHFRIVKDEDFNAFALPGGFIYVNSGLIKEADDDELAGVLGHEIGHVAAQHSVKRLQAELGYQILIAIVTNVSSQEQILRATDISFSLVSLGYSRKDEFLADKLGIKYSRGAGFNPQGVATFFEKLKKQQEKKGPRITLIFLSSHPPIEERINKAKQEIMQAPK
jgi:predicted Zn-dependent protease